NIFVYDMRVQEHDELYEVVVKEGLHLSVRCSVRWQLNHLTLAKLHKKFGPNYLNVLLIPEIGSVLRERISQYELEELFTSRRAQIQREIMKSVVMEAPEKATNRIGHA